jgi:thioredoxin reductase (NADPH)
MSPVRPTVRVVGRRLEPEHHRLRDLFTRTAQPYEFLELGSPEAATLLAEHGLAAQDLPVVVDGGDVYSNATVSRLAEAWNLSRPPSRKHYELAIVGAGPAGLAAAVYAASDGLSTVVIEVDVPGGQASHTSMIENFFGFPDGIGGAELARLAGRQAERFGAELVLLRGVVGSTGNASGAPSLEIDGGYAVTADAVIAANGMEWRRLEVEGVGELLDRCVYYGAGRSEAARCAGEQVVVVGAGNSAGQAVLHLARAGAKVTMIVRGDRLASKMSAYLVERIEPNPLVDVRLETNVTAVHADGDELGAVTISDGTGKSEQLRAEALFLCIGGTPRTAWAGGAGVRVNQAGFVLTGSGLLADGRRPEGWPLDRDPLVLETTIPGLFAAGDLRSGSTKRVAAAVGEGAMAAALVHRRLEELAGGR